MTTDYAYGIRDLPAPEGVSDSFGEVGNAADRVLRIETPLWDMLIDRPVLDPQRCQTAAVADVLNEKVATIAIHLVVRASSQLVGWYRSSCFGLGARQFS